MKNVKVAKEEAELIKINRGLKDAKISFSVENGKPIFPNSSKPNKTVFDILVYGNKKIYDKIYNKIKILLTKKSFLKKIEKIRENYNMPITGFKKPEDFFKWSDKMEKGRFKPVKTKVQSLEMNSKTKQIKNKSKSTYFSKLEEKLADDIETTILKKFRLDNEEFLEPIRWLVLYNNLDYVTDAFKIKLKKNQNGGNELWLKILPHTKKQDIVQLWNRIKLFQQYLPDYRSRIKEWTTIERDFEIYSLYKKYRKKLGLRKRAKTIKYLLQTEMPIDNYISEKIKKKYPNITLSNIRKIISRFKKKFSDI